MKNKDESNGGAAVSSSDIVSGPSDDEIGKAALQFRDDQGEVPSAFAFQQGARWAREMTRLRHANDQALRPDGRSAQDSQQPTKDKNANDSTN